jgi:hypothetical protein
MKRRMALTFAGTAAIVLTAGSAAVAANLGILGSANQEPVGQLDANSVADLSPTTSTSVAPIVVTIDEIVPVPVETPPETTPPAVSGSGGSSGSSGSSASSGSGSAGSQGPSATTSTTARVDNSGHGSSDDDDHSGSDDDHSGGGGDDDDD